MATWTLVWPLLVAFAAHGVTTVDGTPQATQAEVAFLSLQLGGLMGLALLDSNRSLFLRTSPGQRLTAEVLGLGSACALLSAAGLLPLVGWELIGDDLHATDWMLRLPLAGLHLVLVASVLLHLPIGPWPRRFLLPFLTWALPALVGPEAALEPWIRQVFGVAAQLLPDGTLALSWVAYDSGSWAPAATLFGWLLLAWVTVPAQPREYALRDPR